MERQELSHTQEHVPDRLGKASRFSWAAEPHLCTLSTQANSDDFSLRLAFSNIGCHEGTVGQICTRKCTSTCITTYL